MDAEYVKLYVLRVGDTERRLQPVPLHLTHDDYVAVIQDWARFSGDPTEVLDYIKANPYTSERDGLSSLWIDRSGKIHVLSPHQHGVTSFYALAKNCEPDFVHAKISKSPISFRDLTRACGFMRAQYYAGKGLGFSIVTENPPNAAQMAAAKALFETTSRERFTAEIWAGGELIELITDPTEDRAWAQLAGGCLDPVIHPNAGNRNANV